MPVNMLQQNLGLVTMKFFRTRNISSLTVVLYDEAVAACS